MKLSSSHKKVVVVIPLYKEEPSADDIISIKQCVSVLHNHLIAVVKPIGLSLHKYPFAFPLIESFDSHYFSSIHGYNKLMLSSEFYQRFLDFHYILIHQTDAFVFSDQLDYWCGLNYDYIGAPWLYRDYIDIVKYSKERLKGFFSRKFNLKQKGSQLPIDLQFHNVVGNGGFSLRNVNKFYQICIKKQKIISKYLAKKEKQFNEDVLFSIEMNRYKTRIRTPHYKKALLFAIESYPVLAFKLIENQLPFGCHGWDKQRDFWSPIFLKYGIKI
uniref:DUF5672 domain-containing protein n=1 Tax=Sphingobacterium sp. (strain 21) TaxID=743722 RepID=F4CE90_SPHS2